MTTLNHFLLLFLLLSLYLSAVGTVHASRLGTCSATQECTSGCCSLSGHCGFGPEHCGASCLSKCDAKAECGQYAATPGATCPLNACCSQEGVCGITEEQHCGAGCQSGCDEPEQPYCGKHRVIGSSGGVRVGFYESWTARRGCSFLRPFFIDGSKWSHLNFAFAVIDPSTFQIAQMHDDDVQAYGEFTQLKTHSPRLRTLISVGGSAVDARVFSEMASTRANREAFIQSAFRLIKTYAFDGIDLYWVYPGVEDEADAANFVALLSELEAAMGREYDISVTIPSNYRSLRGFDLVNMQPHVGWFNFMTYDLHGPLEDSNSNVSRTVQAHSNLTHIKDSLNLLWRNGIESRKVSLGLAFYGRSYTLADPECATPGCPVSGDGKPGRCNNPPGILSIEELTEKMEEHGLKPTLDEAAAVKYMSWGDQWVSYEDEETFAVKLGLAEDKCIPGSAVWAVTLDSSGWETGIESLMSAVSSMPVEVQTAMRRQSNMVNSIFWTPCLPHGAELCPPGYRAIALGHGKVFDADLNHVTGAGCRGGGRHGFNRALCVEATATFDCQWGPGSRSKACNSKCPEGWMILSQNSHIGGQDVGCKSGRYAALCCARVEVHATSAEVYGPDAFGRLVGGVGGGLMEECNGARGFEWVMRGEEVEERNEEDEGDWAYWDDH